MEISFNSYSQDKELKSFWKSFQTAVTEKKDSAVLKLTFFPVEAEKEYFSFSLFFDSEVIDKIKNSSIYDLEKVQRVSDELHDNPFDILGLPEDIKEVYILTVEGEYEDDESKIPYDRIYVFGKIIGKFKFLGFYVVE
jgi:hypothetical protein